MKFLVECTYVFDHPRDNSGIQRVVRNIIHNLDAVREIAEAIPVVLKNDKIYEVKRLAPDRIDLFWYLLYSKLVQARNRFWSIYGHIKKLWPFSSIIVFRRILSAGFRAMDVCFILPTSAVAHMRQRLEVGKRIHEMGVQSNDVLLLLDSSWHSDLFKQVLEMKSKGVAVISVVYDLIPLTHPQFCDESLVTVFEHWFDWVPKAAEGVVAISKTIRDQVQKFVVQRSQGDDPMPQWFDYFYLGSELDLVFKGGRIRNRVKKPFQNGAPVYLMVSTIEPRKNHDYLIDAFERLWESGLEINLLLVGKVGWKCKKLMKRIKANPEYNRRFFFLNRVTDTELEYCYSKSRCLLLPSFVEGFGLPLVEAMQRGIPAMASDIPVFREVGGDYLAYFDLADSNALADLIRRYEMSGVFPAIKKIEGWSWLTWRESARQLISKIVCHIKGSGVPTASQAGQNIMKG